MVAGYGWIVDGTAEVEAVALSSLAGIAVKDAALAETVAGYSWVADDITEDERWALLRLDALAEKDLALADVVAHYPWVTDDMTWAKYWTLRYMDEIALADLALANALAGYSWISDDLTEAEQRAIRALAQIQGLDPTVARTVAGLAWVVDDITGDEPWVLSTLNAIAGKDLTLAIALAGYSWVADDLTEAEQRAIRALAQIQGLDPTVARTVAGLAWVVDGITEIERQTTEAFHRATSVDPAYAQIIASLPWAGDDITEVELYAIDTLHGVASKDHAFAQTVISLPWVIDDITEVEYRALHGLNANTPDTARQFLEMASPPEALADDPSQWDIELLAALVRLDQETFDDLADVPWFNDGLNGEERALLTVLPFMRRASTHIYNDLVHSRHTLSLTVSLPLAGEVDVWVFVDIPLSPELDPAGAIADTARIAEGLLGVPFPNNEIILIVTPPASVYIDLAAYYGRFMVLWRARGATEVPFIPHETAHYYFSGGLGPTWLVEGGAEFIEAYTRDRLGIQSLEERRRIASLRAGTDCVSDGIHNIRQLNERMRETGVRLPCNYRLGEFFLHNLFEILGEEAFGSALGELYLLSRSERRRVTEEEIYQAFREHTPAKQIRRFQYLYKRWHDGAFLDE